MKAWDEIAYTYDADTHCPDCAEADEMTGEDAKDSEGNTVGVVFADSMSNYSEDGLFCGDCGCVLVDPEDEDEIEEY